MKRVRHAGSDARQGGDAPLPSAGCESLVRSPMWQASDRARPTRRIATFYLEEARTVSVYIEQGADDIQNCTFMPGFYEPDSPSKRGIPTRVKPCLASAPT